MVANNLACQPPTAGMCAASQTRFLPNAFFGDVRNGAHETVSAKLSFGETVRRNVSQLLDPLSVGALLGGEGERSWRQLGETIRREAGDNWERQLAEKQEAIGRDN